MSLTRPLTGPVTRPLTRAITAAGSGGGGSDPLLVAALATSPAWLYDHKDAASFFSDFAMTTQATVGGTVAAILDKSTNARHRRQADATKRPILRQAGSLYYVEYDGVDDWLATAVVDWSAGDAFTSCHGARKLTDAGSSTIFGLGDVDTGNGSLGVRFPHGAAPVAAVFSRGTSSRFVIYNNAAVAAPVTCVLTSLSDISVPVVTLRVNAVQVGTSAVSQGTGNFGVYAVKFGANGALSTSLFSGFDYGGLGVTRQLSGAELTAVEAFVADRTGIVL